MNPKTNLIMKRYIFIISLVFVLNTPQFSHAIVSQKNSGSDGIRGNGKIVKKERSVSGFHSIGVSGGIDVYIIPGNVEKVVVEADENIQEAIVTLVSNGVLKIYCDKSINNSRKLNVYVNVKELDKVTASGGCDVYAETSLRYPSLAFDFSGGSDLKLNCSTHKLSCSLLGGSDAEIRGSADKANLEAIGGSDIKASELTIGKCKVEVTGGSDVNMRVTGELSVEASGSSNVTYTGSPVIISKSLSGASELIKK
jgi:hypothetical protein